MDADRFDTLSCSLFTARSRRGALMAAFGGAIALLGFTDPLARKKGKKGKGKKKGCSKTQKKCGNRCVPKDGCCDSSECDSCPNEFCQSDGRCACNAGAQDSNGRCGFPPNCKSVGLICTSNSECCSGRCTIADGFGQVRCDRGTLECILPFDCVSGQCRGFVCPEIHGCPG
jgi:hypothetical protein